MIERAARLPGVLPFLIAPFLIAPLLAAQPAATYTEQIRRVDGSIIAPAQVDATVTRLLDAGHVTGAAIAIFNDGKLAYEKAYGWRDKAAGLALTTDSVMTAASLTKAAFAVMVLQLVDAGVLDLDRPVQDYLPQPLPDYERYRDLAGDPRWRKITARMLLDHTSGLPNWRWLEDDKKLHLHFMPGSRFAYSGEGIALLQFVVETVTHKPLQQLMHERVFGPYGMRRTSMVWEARFEDDFANGYDEDEHSLGPQRRKKADAAGGMQTTLADYARFELAAMRGDGLQRKTLEQMVSAQVRIQSAHQFPTFESETTTVNRKIDLAYGLGWGVYRSPRGKAIFKEGHDDGWRHYVVWFEQPRIGILIMTNSSNGEGIYQELLETLLRDTFTPLEWERFTPYKKDGGPMPAVG